MFLFLLLRSELITLNGQYFNVIVDITRDTYF